MLFYFPVLTYKDRALTKNGQNETNIYFHISHKIRKVKNNIVCSNSSVVGELEWSFLSVFLKYVYFEFQCDDFFGFRVYRNVYLNSTTGFIFLKNDTD